MNIYCEKVVRNAQIFKEIRDWARLKYPDYKNHGFLEYNPSYDSFYVIDLVCNEWGDLYKTMGFYSGNLQKSVISQSKKLTHSEFYQIVKENVTKIDINEPKYKNPIEMILNVEILEL